MDAEDIDGAIEIAKDFPGVKEATIVERGTNHKHLIVEGDGSCDLIALRKLLDDRLPRVLERQS